MTKLKYILALLLSLTTFAFAENYDDDIYEENEETYSSKQNYQQNLKKSSKKENKSLIFEGYILSEFYVDVLDNSKQKVQYNDSLTNSYLDLDALLKFNIGKGFYTETKWNLKPVNKRRYEWDIYAKNPDYIVGTSYDSDFYGKDNYVRRTFQFSSYGLGVETLSLNYKNSNLGIGLGKIDPTFGSAFDKTRFSGVYGVVMPEEYELTEKLGGYISAIFPFGDLTLNVFCDDTTGLSNTMFKKRGRNKAEGGAGNTKKLNNFSLTFNGKFDNLTLNFGYRQQESKLEYQKTERGFVAGVEYLIELPYNLNLLPFAELAYFNNFDSMESRDVTYLTLFFPAIYENWHFIISNTIKYDDEKTYHNYMSYLTQLSVGYKFDFGLMIDIAKIWQREAKNAGGFMDLGFEDKWVHHKDCWAFMVSYLFKF